MMRFRLNISGKIYYRNVVVYSLSIKPRDTNVFPTFDDTKFDHLIKVVVVCSVVKVPFLFVIKWSMERDAETTSCS